MNESTEPTGTSGAWTPELMAAHKARIEFMEAMGQAHYSRTDAKWHVAHFAHTVGEELEAENAKLRARVEELLADLQREMLVSAARKTMADNWEKKAKDEELQKDVYRNAFLARYAVQLHQNDCMICLGSMICLKGQGLRNSAAIYEERAGELEESVGRQADKQEKPS